MATDFLVKLILSGHDVFLLEDEETDGCGTRTGGGNGIGYGRGYGRGYGPGWGRGYGYGYGYGYGPGWTHSNNICVEKKDRYGYRISR